MTRKLIVKFVMLVSVFCMLMFNCAMADETAGLSITIVSGNNEVTFENMTWNLYKVADRGEEETYELTGSFSEYNVSLEDQTTSGLAEIASTLANYVVTDSIDYDMKSVGNSEGKVFFSDTEDYTLTDGVYLATGSAVIIDNKKITPAPMLVELASWSEENAQLTVIAKPVIEELLPAPVEYTVTKIWDDDDTTAVFRSSSVTVEIYCNGELAETVKLSEENNWSYSWTDGENCEWNVKETEVPKYYRIVYRSDNRDYVIVNTFDMDLYLDSDSTGVENPTPTPTPPSGDKLPQTGQFWWPVPVLIIVGIILVVLGIKFLKTDEN